MKKEGKYSIIYKLKIFDKLKYVKKISLTVICDYNFLVCWYMTFKTTPKKNKNILTGK